MFCDYQSTYKESPYASLVACFNNNYETYFHKYYFPNGGWKEEGG